MMAMAQTGVDMKETSIRERFEEEYPDSELLFMTEDQYDAAVIGVSEMCAGTSNNHQVIYDIDKVLQVNMEMGMTEEEALEFFDYNQGGAYVGENTPIFVKVSELNK